MSFDEMVDRQIQETAAELHGDRQIRIEALRAAVQVTSAFVSGVMAREDEAEAKELLGDVNEVADRTKGLAKRFERYLESGE